jgi:hypothetical protein
MQALAAEFAAGAGNSAALWREEFKKQFVTIYVFLNWLLNGRVASV